MASPYLAITDGVQNSQSLVAMEQHSQLTAPLSRRTASYQMKLQSQHSKHIPSFSCKERGERHVLAKHCNLGFRLQKDDHLIRLLEYICGVPPPLNSWLIRSASDRYLRSRGKSGGVALLVFPTLF